MASATSPARELTVIPVACRFYGRNGQFGRLVPTGGNQCGIIKQWSAPCQLEANGKVVDETRCVLVLDLVAGEETRKFFASGPTEAEREAFEKGRSMGRNQLDDCPYDDSELTAVWLIGHGVGELHRRAGEEAEQ